MGVEEKAKQYNAVTEGVLWKQLLLFCLPIFFQSVFQQVFGVADAVIVGQGIGKTALGAITSANNLTRLFLSMFLGFCSGAAIIIGQAWGAGNTGRVSSIIRTGVAFSVAGGVGTAAVCVPMTPMFMKLMRIPADMLPYAAVYTRIVFIGFIAMFIYNMAAGFLRAVGDSKRPFYYLIVSLILNLLLDLLFVLVFRWGVAGAAAATALSQAAAAALSLRQLFRLDSAPRTDGPRRAFDGNEVREMARLGAPMGISGVLYAVSNIALQSAINVLGTDIIAGWSIYVKIDTVIWSLYEAFRIAAATFAAQNFGAGKYGRVRSVVRSSLAVGAGVIVPVCALMYAFCPSVSRLFVSDGAVTAYSVWLCRFTAPFYILFLFGDVFAASIRGCGEVVRPMILTLIGTCGFRLLWVALIHVFGGPSLLNVAASYPASWFFNSLLVSLYYFFGKWRSRLSPAGNPR